MPDLTEKERELLARNNQPLVRPVEQWSEILGKLAPHEAAARIFGDLNCYRADRIRGRFGRERRDGFLSDIQNLANALQAFTTPDNNQHAKDNAAGWWDTIKELVAALDDGGSVDGEDLDADAAAERIRGSALSVMVRGGWYAPGAKAEGPEEYEILLTTGGPALRIYGRMDQYGEPDMDLMLQWQDWGTPWVDWWPEDARGYKDTLLAFASMFYFGE